MVLAGASPHATSAELAGVSGLAGAFGFGSELAELLVPPATAVIWQSMPTVLWIACRRFSEWSARPNAPANPVVVKASVRTWPSNAPTWAFGSTSAHVLRLILDRVCRTSGQARRRTSTSPLEAGPAGAAPAVTCAEVDGGPVTGEEVVGAVLTGAGLLSCTDGAGRCDAAAAGRVPADSSTGQSLVLTRGGVSGVLESSAPAACCRAGSGPAEAACPDGCAAATEAAGAGV